MSQKPSVEPNLKSWRPFLRLSKYLPDDFLETAERWMVLVSGYGISKVPQQPETREEYLAFFAHCHDGWKQAQTEIATFLMDALTRQAEAREDKNEQHRLKNKEAKKQARARVEQIRLEIAVARRMLDVILWTIFAGEHSTLRRLIVDGGEHNLSKENIAVAMAEADHHNKNPQVMALSTDMLSLVHVGDLILANREKGSIEFVELKSGTKNTEIATKADFAVQSECELFESLVTADLNETDKKHYERVKKQAKRNDMILSTILNEGGTDPNTGAKVVINSTPEPPEYWCGRITRCYERLDKDKHWAIDVIDECVYLGVYSDQGMAFAGFQMWMDQVRCASPIFSLMDSFLDPNVRPLGAILISETLRRKVLRGEILVVMCLDILKFIDLGNRIFPGSMRLATKAETAKMRRHSMGMGSLMLNNKLICTTIAGQDLYLGAGTRDRILFDQHSPAQLLKQRFAVSSISP